MSILFVIVNEDNPDYPYLKEIKFDSRTGLMNLQTTSDINTALFYHESIGQFTIKGIKKIMLGMNLKLKKIKVEVKPLWID